MAKTPPPPEPPAAPTPALAPVAPLPDCGGAFVRLPDGSLAADDAADPAELTET